MLEILLIIWIGRTFFKYAKTNNISAGLWTTLGIVSYIVGMFIGILILGIVSPYDLDNLLMAYAFGLPGAAIATVGTYFLMRSSAKMKNEYQESDVLDEEQ